jgi:hypothetical protein
MQRYKIYYTSLIMVCVAGAQQARAERINSWCEYNIEVEVKSLPNLSSLGTVELGIVQANGEALRSDRNHSAIINSYNDAKAAAIQCVTDAAIRTSSPPFCLSRADATAARGAITTFSMPSNPMQSVKNMKCTRERKGQAMRAVFKLRGDRGWTDAEKTSRDGFSGRCRNDGVPLTQTDFRCP